MYVSKKGIAIPEIWMPSHNVDLTKWACIACDQYTSQPEYWANVEKIVADAPSTLRMMLPEVYLPATDEMLRDIDNHMAQYMEQGILENKGEYVTYIERGSSNGKTRHGWLVAIDLEKYDFDPAKNALIRASEATVISRIPPRVKIRASARLEMPHVMLLVDDPSYTLDKVTYSGTMDKIYDLDLMANGGHITGYKVSNDTAMDLINAMESMESEGGMLFAVGDGNHSLASAKALWQQIKADGADENHPARFALVEVVNIHDQALDFEPIHRVVLKADMENFFDKLNAYFAEEGIQLEAEGDTPIFTLYADGNELPVYTKAAIPMVVKPIQMFLDRFVEGTDVEVDYIHGEQDLKDICDRDGGIGILLPAISKAGVMESVSRSGALPRKAFSMGEAMDKRYYMEARKIIR